jgi:hypothetical protein
MRSWSWTILSLQAILSFPWSRLSSRIGRLRISFLHGDCFLTGPLMLSSPFFWPSARNYQVRSAL